MTSTLSRPAPCSALESQIGKAYCTCRCCFEGYCPNSFEGHYNAHTYSNVGDPAAACNEALCRLHFGRKGSCPSHGEGGEGYAGHFLIEACPAPSPPAAPVLCAAGSLQDACDCSCCAETPCDDAPLRQFPIPASGCTPAACSSEFAGCTMNADDDAAHVVASIVSLSPCEDAATAALAPPASPTAANLTASSSGTPMWVLVVLPLLAVALLAAGLVLFGIRRRERRTGKPIFFSVEMEKVGAPAATTASTAPN